MQNRVGKEPKASSPKKGSVSSTAKALMILDCFTPVHTALTLTQISRELSIPKSTLFSQLRTLEDAGFLMKDKNSQTYRLGYRIMQLSYCARMASPVAQYAVPVMEDLQAATGEIIYLTSYIGDRVFYLECVYPSRRFISYSVSGKTLPMYCTGCGKAMLSQMPASQVEDILRRSELLPRTPNTITDYDRLMEEIATCRKVGYAIDNEEETRGVKCIAMAIHAPDGRVAGALSISGSPLSIRQDNIEEYAQLLSRGCNALSQYGHLFPAIQLSDSN